MKTLDVIRMELKGIPRDAADDLARAVSDLLDVVAFQGKLITVLQARVTELESKGQNTEPDFDLHDRPD